MERSAHVKLIWCGALGGLVYLIGDFLFFGTTGDGATFRSLPIMSARSDAILIAGGWVAPLATMLYVLGARGVTLSLCSMSPRIARIFFMCWAAMFTAGASYHAVFTTLGFAGKVADAQARDALLVQIRSLLAAIYWIELVGGILGTLLLAMLLWKSQKRWLLLLMPTIWALLEFLPRLAPAPLGAPLSAAWINGWFVIFFAAAARSLETRPVTSGV
jgi:hypothetical protein